MCPIGRSAGWTSCCGGFYYDLVPPDAVYHASYPVINPFFLAYLREGGEFICTTLIRQFLSPFIRKVSFGVFSSFPGQKGQPFKKSGTAFLVGRL